MKVLESSFIISISSVTDFNWMKLSEAVGLSVVTDNGNYQMTLAFISGLMDAAAAAAAADDDDDDDDAGDATVHNVLRNAAARCTSEAKTWSFAIVFHA